MFAKYIIRKLLLFTLSSTSVLFYTQAQSFKTFVEYGATIHKGENTPLWQVSNQHGLSSINNNTYIRGGAFYNKTIHSLKIETGVDGMVYLFVDANIYIYYTTGLCRYPL